MLRGEGVAGSACTTTSGPLGARITDPLFYLVLFLPSKPRRKREEPPPASASDFLEEENELSYNYFPH